MFFEYGFVFWGSPETSVGVPTQQWPTVRLLLMTTTAFPNPPTPVVVVFFSSILGVLHSVLESQVTCLSRATFQIFSLYIKLTWPKNYHHVHLPVRQPFLVHNVSLQSFSLCTWDFIPMSPGLEALSAFFVYLVIFPMHVFMHPLKLHSYPS